MTSRHQIASLLCCTHIEWHHPVVDCGEKFFVHIDVRGCLSSQAATFFSGLARINSDKTFESRIIIA